MSHNSLTRAGRLPIGDVNGDGKADLVWRHSSTGTVAVWAVNGADHRGGREYRAGHRPGLADPAVARSPNLGWPIHSGIPCYGSVRHWLCSLWRVARCQLWETAQVCTTKRIAGIRGETQSCTCCVPENLRSRIHKGVTSLPACRREVCVLDRSFYSFLAFQWQPGKH